MSGWRAPRGARSVGRVTSTVSSTSIRSSASASSTAVPLGERLADRAAGLADALAGLLARLRRQGADLAVGQRQRRPVAGVVEAGLLERRRGRAAAAIAASASSRIAVDLLRLERGDLDRVVLGVRARHGSLSRSAT